MDNVKIVFTDLDNTLTSTPEKVDIKNKDVFEKLSNIGIPVVLNTGRSLPYAIPICKQYMLSNYVITSNGAEIYNMASDTMLYRNIISKENLEKLDKLVIKHNLYFTCNGIKKRYSNKIENGMKLSYVNAITEVKDEISQVVVQSVNIEDMIAFKKDLMDIKLKIVNKSKYVVEGKMLYYDIVNPDVSKGNALKILCNHLTIDISRSMAIGDSSNDLEMLESAGYKVAVANATDDLKAIADTITLSNTDNGVYVVLSELYSKLR